MDTISLSQLLERYTLLSNDELPNDQNILKTTAIAEGIRLAIYYNRDSDGNIVPTNPIHLRNWVIRKLRSVIPEIRENGDSIIMETASDILIPNLEFMGDIVRLSDGTFLPCPTRVIPMGNNFYNLVSGTPTRELIQRGVKIQAYGAIRRTDLSSSTVNKIPQQTIDSYLELNRYDCEKSHIEYLLETGQRVDWPPSSSKKFEGYSGFTYGRRSKNESKGPYGFQNWSSNPIERDVNGALVSLWREELPWGQCNYWLRVKKKLEHAIVREIVDNGELGKQIIEFDRKSIKVPMELFRFVALEIDSLGGSKRGIEISSDEHNTELAIGFAPPDSLRRWLFACGSCFSGYSNDLMIWPIPPWAVEETERVAKQMKLHIEKKVGGRK